MHTGERSESGFPMGMESNPILETEWFSGRNLISMADNGTFGQEMKLSDLMELKEGSTNAIPS